jgi:hypothetical protein
MQYGINIGNDQLLMVNLTVILIVFAAGLIVLVTASLYIAANVSRIAKILEQKQDGQDSPKV